MTTKQTIRNILQFTLYFSLNKKKLFDFNLFFFNKKKVVFMIHTYVLLKNMFSEVFMQFWKKLNESHDFSCRSILGCYMFFPTKVSSLHLFMNSSLKIPPQHFVWVENVDWGIATPETLLQTRQMPKLLLL